MKTKREENLLLIGWGCRLTWPLQHDMVNTDLRKTMSKCPSFVMMLVGLLEAFGLKWKYNVVSTSGIFNMCLNLALPGIWGSRSKAVLIRKRICEHLSTPKQDSSEPGGNKENVQQLAVCHLHAFRKVCVCGRDRVCAPVCLLCVFSQAFRSDESTCCSAENKVT